jgi:hypothetical protein
MKKLNSKMNLTLLAKLNFYFKRWRYERTLKNNFLFGLLKVKTNLSCRQLSKMFFSKSRCCISFQYLWFIHWWFGESLSKLKLKLFVEKERILQSVVGLFHSTIICNITKWLLAQKNSHLKEWIDRKSFRLLLKIALSRKS